MATLTGGNVLIEIESIIYMVKSVEVKSEIKGRKGRRKNFDLDPSGVNVDMTMDAGDAEI
jgi:uncharacterized protein (AIM24 family)